MAMRSMRRFYSEIKGKKVNELPAYIKSTYSMESVKTYVMKAPSTLSFISASEAWLSLTSFAIPHEKCYFEKEYAKEEKKLAKEKLAKAELAKEQHVKESFPISRDDL
ncbi:hypothetical protein HID58_040753 [Brassica napus]|uniref:Uncharacterized protein n=3 Tax=Brassica TaxID=3705 RepID=A0A0D3A393_BRAOL|nr:hypothetical protein HID58_040753 [Brassica napus]CAF2068937.1 unnamed protein product [Brassica napus]VDD48510.1 unnamed protein product [Brassica oleracea]